jgi:8-oxo-dGTP pyrophosphatase MutT (NUDIX family)
VTVPIQPAATVMLIRDALDGDGGPQVEVCMLRRNLDSEFVAGVYVFPGGSVDSADHGPEVEARCQGRSDAEASAVLGVESGGLAYWVAALRECFEECGVMLARRRVDGGSGGPLLDTSDPEVAARFAAYRDAVNQQRLGLLDICRQEDLVLVVDSVHYVSHWITPELAPRRYDTRFFVTAAPTGQIAHHDETETIATIWVRPKDALAREAAGEIELLPPTIANLRSIEGFTSTAEVMAWASQVTHVTTVLPIVLIEDGHILILRPGDSGYEEAMADRMASGAEVDPALAELARQAWGPGAGSG